MDCGKASMDATFWKNRRVLVTGHTGFKGAWLSLWLARRGAHVVGYSLDPPASISLFSRAHVGHDVLDCRGDVRDPQRLASILVQQRIETVFHLAAQPLVRRSFAEPVETFSTNVMGTVSVLEAIRHASTVQS